MENKKVLILKLFFEENKRVKDIANLLNVSSAYISKIIKTDSRYDVEKANRKETTISRHRNVSCIGMRNRREQRKIDEAYHIVEEQHRQAVGELSGSKRLSNEDYRSWNKSAYTYDEDKKRFEFRSNLGRSADVPKYMKVKK